MFCGVILWLFLSVFHDLTDQDIDIPQSKVKENKKEEIFRES